DEPAFDEPQDLVAAHVGLHELRVRTEVIEERLLILRQAEEVVLLAGPLRLQRRMQRAVAVDEVFLLLELLAAATVPTLVDALVDVARRVDALRDLGHAGSVPRLGGACEGVERDAEMPP